MMGYTHAAVGAAGGVGMAIASGCTTPREYIVASIAGALGGAAIDIDVKDKLEDPKITDGSRTRLFVLGMIILGVAIDVIFKQGIVTTIMSRQKYAIGGAVAFLILMLYGHLTDHRTMTHSLLFSVLTSICLYFVYPPATVYYFIGCILHLLLDMMNNKVPHNGTWHGLWLLYPVKLGDGIALGLSKAGDNVNKGLYFIGITLFTITSAYYFWNLQSITKAIPLVILLIYSVVALHFVRVKSEKELRHKMGLE